MCWCTRQHNQSIKKLYYTTFVVKLFMCHSWLSRFSIGSDKMRSLAVTQHIRMGVSSLIETYSTMQCIDSLAWKGCIMLIAWRRLASDSIDISADLIRAVMRLESREKTLFMELVRGVHSMKGNFWVSWSEPTPRKVIFKFHGVTLLHERQFLSFMECTPWKGIFEFRGVSLLHKREFLIFM